MTLLLGILVNFVGGIHFHAAGTVFEMHNKGQVPDIIEIDAVDTLHEVKSTSSLVHVQARPKRPPGDALA